ncbi:MAG: hypothetical protein ACYTDT_14270 [Planctomycetota bacterium]
MSKKKRRSKPDLRTNPPMSAAINERTLQIFQQRGGDLLTLAIESAKGTTELYLFELQSKRNDRDYKFSVSPAIATRAASQLKQLRKERDQLWHECLEQAANELAPPEQTPEAEPEEKPSAAEAVIPANDVTQPEPRQKADEPAVNLTG